MKRIRITPSILLEAARTKVWPISYPEHRLRSGRPDITFNKILFGGVGIFGLVLWLSREFGT